VIGVVIETGPVSTIIVKTTGKELSKRNLTIVDTSSGTIEVTIWAEKAENPGWREDDNPVVAFKSIKVSDFNGNRPNCIICV
jgi:replication factor A1